MDEARIRQIIKEEFARNRQQIAYPLDETSRAIVNENVPVFQTFTAGAGGTNGFILVKINGQLYKLMTTA